MNDEIDGMKRPAPSVRESIELGHLRTKLRLVSQQAGVLARTARSEEVRGFAVGIQEEADASMRRIEGMVR